MTTLLCLILAGAIYFEWSPAATGVIAACAILALVLDTRAALASRGA